VSYRCQLSRFVGDVPRRESSREKAIVLNPMIFYAKDGAVPGSLLERFRVPAPLDLRGAVVWVQAPLTRAYFPYSLDGELRDHFERLFFEGASPATLPAEIRLLFRYSHILLERGSASVAAVWIRTIRRLGKAVRSRGYACLPRCNGW
jgi:hypothetical protein